MSEPKLQSDASAALAAAADPGLAALLRLDGVDPAQLSRRGLLDALVALERTKAWVEARQQHVLAALATEPASAGHRAAPGAEIADTLDKEWVREEVACALRVAAPTAAARLRLASELTGRLPHALGLLHAGRISLPMARRLAEATVTLDQQTARAVEVRVLGRAPTQTFSQFARAVTRAVLTLDPRGQEEKHAAAYDERRIARRPVEDGMAELTAILRADHAEDVWAAIDHTTRCDTDPGDERTIDQRRADVFVQLVSGRPARCGCGTDVRPSGSAAGPAVQVTVAASTLLGLDEQAGELAGYGPVPAALARALAADPTGTWRRLVTDDYGRLLDYGRSTYRPPAALADQVRARDRTCRFPTCNRRADRCELDHAVPWQDGGTTSAANLHALCARHHHTKHDAGWRAVRHHDGSTEWIGPTGHRFVKPAEVLPLDTTAAGHRPLEHGPPTGSGPPRGV